MRAPGPGQLFGLSRCSGAATQAQSRPHRPRGNRSTAPRFAPGNTCSRGDSEDTRGSCWRRYQIGLGGEGPSLPSAPPPRRGRKEIMQRSPSCGDRGQGEGGVRRSEVRRTVLPWWSCLFWALCQARGIGRGAAVREKLCQSWYLANLVRWVPCPRQSHRSEILVRHSGLFQRSARRRLTGASDSFGRCRRWSRPTTG